MIQRYTILILLFMVTPMVHSQVATESYDGKYDSDKHFRRLYNDENTVFAFKATTKSELLSWQHSFLPRLKEALGLDKLERQYSHYQPKTEKVSVEDKGDFLLQKWIVWTEVDVPLPVVVLIPKNVQGKNPLVITLHGHGKNSVYYDGIYPRVTDTSSNAEVRMSATSVKQGYITIAPTVRAFGNTRTSDDVTEGLSFSCRSQLKKDLLVGRTPVGERVWDLQVILGWALRNFPVDKERVAVTGHSGGATVALFAAAVDKRIKVAVLSSYLNTFKGSIGSINHCECNYIPGILTLGEMSDVAGLIAPRSVLFVHGSNDPIYPIGETRKAYNALKRIYKYAGAESHVSLYEGQGGHQYYEEAVWPFIKKQFGRLNIHT